MAFSRPLVSLLSMYARIKQSSEFSTVITFGIELSKEWKSVTKREANLLKTKGYVELTESIPSAKKTSAPEEKKPVAKKRRTRKAKNDTSN